MANPNSKRKRNRDGKSMADLADKFDCYQKSVQVPEHEVVFFDQAYREAYRRKPNILREDFCGTFNVCCHWVESSPGRTAVGVDLCAETLEWGKQNNLARLTPNQRKRVRLVEADVRKRTRPQADVLAAQNFSFWIFKTRTEVVEYFRAARSNLASKGILVMDMMGGGDCYAEGQKDKRKIGKGKRAFRYDWEQVSHNPVTGESLFHIHFKFRDGSKLERAFEYDWRFWTIPEVREMLLEAGFQDVHAYFEVEDEDGEDTGEWQRMEDAPSHPCWICYLVAVK